MTYLEMIKQVILTNRSPKGMSLAAIKKGVEALKTDGKGIQGPHVTKVLKQAVEEGVLTKCDGQRYKLTPEQRKEIKKESPKKAKSPSPKKASKPKKKKTSTSTAPKATKPKKTKAKNGPAGASKSKKKKA